MFFYFLCFFLYFFYFRDFLVYEKPSEMQEGLLNFLTFFTNFFNT